MESTATSPALVSRLLVLAQFLLSAALVIPGTPFVWKHPWLWLPILIGAWMVFNAVRIMKLDKLRIHPEPGEQHLCETGIYKRVRHPMYSGLLLASAPFAPGLGWWGAMIWAALVVTLVLKLLREEHYLVDHFPGYRDYAKRTSRLIPGVY